MKKVTVPAVIVKQDHSTILASGPYGMAGQFRVEKMEILVNAQFVIMFHGAQPVTLNEKSTL